MLVPTCYDKYSSFVFTKDVDVKHYITIFEYTASIHAGAHHAEPSHAKVKILKHTFVTMNVYSAFIGHRVKLFALFLAAVQDFQS